MGGEEVGSVIAPLTVRDFRSTIKVEDPKSCRQGRQTLRERSDKVDRCGSLGSPERVEGPGTQWWSRARYQQPNLETRSQTRRRPIPTAGGQQDGIPTLTVELL